MSPWAQGAPRREHQTTRNAWQERMSIHLALFKPARSQRGASSVREARGHVFRALEKQRVQTPRASPRHRREFGLLLAET